MTINPHTANEGLWYQVRYKSKASDCLELTCREYLVLQKSYLNIKYNTALRLNISRTFHPMFVTAFIKSLLFYICNFVDVHYVNKSVRFLLV